MESPAFDYEQIGINHNKALDYMFEPLKSQKKLFKGDAKTYLSLVEAAGLEYVETLNYEISADSMDLIKKEISGSIRSSLNKFNNFSVARTLSSEDIYAQVVGDSDSLLSIAQRDYVREILSLMENETDIDKFLVRLSVIEQNVDKTLIPDEQPMILTVVSVARYSQVYWNENQEKWLNEFGGANSDGRLEINWRVVGGFDAAAAIGLAGAVGLAALGGPVGWGFAASVIGGGTAIISGAAIWATLGWEELDEDERSE